MGLTTLNNFYEHPGLPRKIFVYKTNINLSTKDIPRKNIIGYSNFLYIYCLWQTLIPHKIPVEYILF
jgi:hypothetical protein